MLNDYVKKFFNSDEYGLKNKYEIWTYTSIDEVGPDDFLNHIYITGKLIRNNTYVKEK